MKFSLAGDQGLNIIAAGFPKVVWIACEAGTPEEELEGETAGSSSLQYDSAEDQYIYVWKTDKGWKNTCRQFQLKLIDGETYSANFKFK
jgi:hypothetical protein